MTIGITLYGNDPKFIASLGRRAEELGFDGLWIGEHIVAPEVMGAEHPYEGGWTKPPVVSADPRIYDLWTMVGALIGATSRVKVVTGIALLPLRHPIISARACITAQQISDGRFMFGVGAGWLATEFAALGVSFDDRAKRYNECLDVLEKLFKGGPVEHHGQFFSFPSLALTDEKVSVPLLVGGTKTPALRRAALRGDGWYGTTIPLEETMQIREEIEKYRREFGRDKTPFTYYNRIVGQPIAESVKRYRAEGFNDIVIPFEAIHPSDSHDQSLEARTRSLERAAQELELTPRIAP